MRDVPQLNNSDDEYYRQFSVTQLRKAVETTTWSSGFAIICLALYGGGRVFYHATLPYAEACFSLSLTAAFAQSHA